MRRLLIAAVVSFCVVCICAGLCVRAVLLRPISLQGPVEEKAPQSHRSNFHKLSLVQKAHILDGAFSIERDVSHLPEGLKSAFSQLTGDDFKMANPGEKYQVTDVVVDPELPRRRLLLAGISKDKYFLHYEKGGIAHSYYLAVFEVDPQGKAEFFWGGPGDGAKDLTQLRSMVAGGAFADDREYDW